MSNNAWKATIIIQRWLKLWDYFVDSYDDFSCILKLEEFNGMRKSDLILLSKIEMDACRSKSFFSNNYFWFQVNLDQEHLAQLEHDNQVSAVALCPDNSQLVSGTRGGKVTLWCLESYSVIQELPAHKRQVNGVKFSCDAKRVVSCGSDFYMKVIDLQTGTILLSRGK